MKAAVITVGPHDVSGPRWGHGSFALSDFLGWSHLVANQEDSNRLRALLRQKRSRRLLARATSRLPAGEAGRTLLGEGAPWWESWVEHPDADDPFWAALNLRRALDTTEVPVLLISGWQDLFLEQTIAQYRRLHERGVDVGLTVGPWTHTQLLTKAAPTVIRETLDSLGTRSGTEASDAGQCAHLRHRPGLDRPAGVAAGDARGGALFPTRRSPRRRGAAGDRLPVDVHLQPGPSDADGGRLLSPEAGYRKDTGLAQRADVLSFTGDRLPTDLYVVGAPVVELSHSCDNPHNDLFVRVSAVDAKGRSRNVSDGYLSAAPDFGPVRIELDPIAHRFRAGSRIRVLVAGGAHPRFARNLGRRRTARHRQHACAGHPYRAPRSEPRPSRGVTPPRKRAHWRAASRGFCHSAQTPPAPTGSGLSTLGSHFLAMLCLTQLRSTLR